MPVLHPNAETTLFKEYEDQGVDCYPGIIRQIENMGTDTERKVLHVLEKSAPGSPVNLSNTSSPTR